MQERPLWVKRHAKPSATRRFGAMCNGSNVRMHPWTRIGTTLEAPAKMPARHGAPNGVVPLRPALHPTENSEDMRWRRNRHVHSSSRVRRIGVPTGLPAHFVRDDNQAHSKHTTARAAPPVTSRILVPAPLADMIRIGTATTATKSPTNGIALGRAKFTVQPIHFRRRGTITRGSALQ